MLERGRTAPTVVDACYMRLVGRQLPKYPPLYAIADR